MKFLLIPFLLLLICPFTAYSQNEDALKDVFSSTIVGSDVIYYGTTLEEYNYLTKGYKLQLSNGLGMKPGYSFKDYGVRRNKNNRRSVEVKGLLREGETVACAYLMTTRNDKTKEVKYLCIPGDDTDPTIWDLVSNDIYKEFTPKVSLSIAPDPIVHGDYLISLMKIISQLNK